MSLTRFVEEASSVGWIWLVQPPKIYWAQFCNYTHSVRPLLCGLDSRLLFLCTCFILNYKICIPASKMDVSQPPQRFGAVSTFPRSNPGLEWRGPTRPCSKAGLSRISFAVSRCTWARLLCKSVHTERGIRDAGYVIKKATLGSFMHRHFFTARPVVISARGP